MLFEKCCTVSISTPLFSRITLKLTQLLNFERFLPRNIKDLLEIFHTPFPLASTLDFNLIRSLLMYETASTAPTKIGNRM